MISQSTITFLFLLLAFLIFVAQRGELAQYLALLYGGGTPAPSPPGSQPAPGGGATPPPANAQTSSIDTFAKVAEAAAPYVIAGA
jgi:hypothetical protein